MNIHHNARLTFRGRELLVKRIVEQGLRVEEAAQASGVSVRTAYKWLRRYRQEGITGLYDRSSRPRHCPHQTSAHRHQEIVRLRRLRRTYRQISRQFGVSQSTVDCASVLESPTSAPDLTHRVPTARPSGSSRLRCVSGPMRVRTATQASVLENSRDGCTTTTGTDNTPESITNAPSTLWGST